MKQIIISCCVALLSIQGYAQKSLTLEECEQMALKNSRQAQLSDYSIEKAKAEMNAMRSNYLPKISASGGYLYADKDFSMNLIPSMAMTLNPNNSYFAGIQLEQPIYMGGKIVAANKISRIGFEITTLDKNKTNSDILIAVDAAYWGLAKISEQLIVAQKYKETVEELCRNVEHLYQKGMTSKNNLLKVQVKLNEADLSLHRVQNAIQHSKMSLCHIIGMPLTSEIHISGDLDVINTSRVTEEFVVENRSEYQMLSKIIDIKRQEVKLAQSEFLPQIGLVAGYNYLDGMKMNTNKLLSDDLFSVMVAVKIPLFNWGEGRNKVKAARLKQRIAETQRTDLSEKMHLEASQVANLLEEAALEILLAEAAFKHSEENLRESRQNYSTGTETLVNYMEAQTIWQKTWSEYVSAKANYRLTESQYLKSIGKLSK